MSDSDLKEQRKKNLEQLKATGINVYPYSYKPDCTLGKRKISRKTNSSHKVTPSLQILIKAGVNFFTASWITNCIQAKKNPESIAKKIGNNPVINWEILAESHFKIEIPKKITRTARLTLKLTFSFKKNQLR